MIWIFQCSLFLINTHMNLFNCRLIETDAKSLNSLGGNGHSRRSSDTSQISVTSGSSNATTAAQDLSQDSQVSTSTNGAANSEEELWLLWGKIINEWEVFHKRKSSQVKVCVINYSWINGFSMFIVENLWNETKHSISYFDAYKNLPTDVLWSITNYNSIIYCWK